MGWHDLLPPDVADRQVAWERYQMCVRVRASGAVTVKEMALRLGVSRARVYQMIAYANKGGLSPVEEYLKPGAPMKVSEHGPIKDKIREAAKHEAVRSGLTLQSVLHQWAMQGVEISAPRDPRGGKRSSKAH